MFRIKLDDPHPFPWIRVRLSLAFGQALFPHPQWSRFEALWDRLYPLNKADEKSRQIIDSLERTMPAFVSLVVNHSPAVLKGKKLANIFPFRRRQPERLRDLYRHWKQKPEAISAAPPSLVFAVIGQAHADGTISATTEGKLLSDWLTRWAFLRSENRTAKESHRLLYELKNLITD